MRIVCGDFLPVSGHRPWDLNWSPNFGTATLIPQTTYYNAQWACTSRTKHDQSAASKIKATLAAKVWQQNEAMKCGNGAKSVAYRGFFCVKLVWHTVVVIVNQTIN